MSKIWDSVVLVTESRSPASIPAQSGNPRAPSGGMNIALTGTITQFPVQEAKVRCKRSRLCPGLNHSGAGRASAGAQGRYCRAGTASASVSPPWDGSALQLCPLLHSEKTLYCHLP